MLLVSDVHAAVGPLRRLVAIGEPVIVLGDLANLTDYRSGEGAIADVLGVEFARAAARARGDGDYPKMRSLWSERVGDRGGEVREEIGEAIGRQYEEIRRCLEGGRGFVIHGNVDRIQRLPAALPEGFRYVHGEALEIDGMSIGFVGGGVATPIGADGEVSDNEMTRLLSLIGPVDVLCTHVPPYLRPLTHDVITGRVERGSKPILEYIQRHQPRFHFFGDVHQAKASTWRIGSTRCFNAGYFRATGRYLRLTDAVVHVERLS